jgi:hypothetical protein
MTTKSINGAAWVGLLFAFAVPVSAQSGPVISRAQLLQNQSKLKVTIALDRQEYLPGELAELTISIANPTPQTLEIPRPFDVETGGPFLLEKNRRTPDGVVPGYSPALLSPDKAERLPGLETSLLSIQIRSGETITQKFQSWDPARDGWGSLIYRGSAPTWAGDFRLEYWGGQTDFRVMSPAFERMTKILLPEWTNVTVGLRGETQREQLRTFAFALEAEGRHYLCLFNHALPYDPDPVRNFHLGLVRPEDMESLRAYHRIAESVSPVLSVSGEADRDGTITVRWGSTGEGLRRLRRDEWRLAVPETSGNKK